MTIVRSRVSISLQILLQVIQLSLLTSKDQTLTFQFPIDNQEYVLTHLVLLVSSLLLQCVLFATVYRIDRSYDLRNQHYNEQEFASYYHNIKLNEFCLPPRELNIPITRNRIKESLYLVAYCGDVLIRVTRLLVGSFWLVNSWRYYFMVLLIEQMIYFLGQVQYIVILCLDEGYLRSLMISMDFITRRERAVGYSEVYRSGYTFSALPAMMFMSVKLIHIALTLLPTFIVFINAMISMSRVQAEAETLQNSSSTSWEMNRFNYLLLGFCLSLIAIQLTPMIFWLEDNPSTSWPYLLAFTLACSVNLIEFFYQVVGVIYWFAKLDNVDWFSRWTQHAVTNIALGNMLLFLLAIGVSQFLLIACPEYHLRIGDHRIAWSTLLQVAEPLQIKTVTEKLVRRVYGYYGQSVFTSLVISALIEPWIAIAFYDIKDDLPLFLVIAWYVNTLWRCFILVRSVRIGLELPTYSLEDREQFKKKAFEYEKHSLMVTEILFGLLSITAFGVYGNDLEYRWSWIFFLILSTFRLALSGIVQVWLEFFDTKYSIAGLLFAPIASRSTSRHRGTPHQAYEAITLPEANNAVTNFHETRKWIHTSTQEAIRSQHIEALMQKYSYSLSILTREQLMFTYKRGRLEIVHGPLGMVRLRELIYSDRRVLLLLAYYLRNEGNAKLAAVNRSNSTTAGSGNIICRLKDHDPYLLRVIASYL